MKKLTVLFLAVMVVFTFAGGKGGGGNDGGTYTPPVDPDGLTSWEFEEKFADDAVYYWNGMDFSFNTPTGYTDSDFDGETDANDTVIVVETLKNMGYDVPETSIDGLYYNYYTDAGYDVDMEDYYTKIDFDFTQTNSVGEADLQDGDWWLMDKGDLIFVDYDKDFSYDNAAIYLGSYGGYSNACLIASDYYDSVVIMDLDYEYEWINQDIAYGYSDSKTLDYWNIEDTF